jgi:hypothetical protein
VPVIIFISRSNISLDRPLASDGIQVEIFNDDSDTASDNDLESEAGFQDNSHIEKEETVSVTCGDFALCAHFTPYIVHTALTSAPFHF